MTLVLEPRHLAAIREHGEKDYPAEACGLLGGTEEEGRAVVHEVVPFANERTDSARNRYLIDPLGFRRADETLERVGLKVVGVYHSHPDHPAEPSAFDRENAWPQLRYVIVGVARGRAGEAKCWRLADDRTAFAEEPITLEERKVAWPSQS